MATTNDATHPQTALITGASGGIGEALARALAAEKYDVVLVARSVDKLHKLAAELHSQSGVTATVLAADLGQPGAALALQQQLEKRGLHIDVLVNNAGFAVFGAFPETDLAREADMIQLNIVALTELTKVLLPAMLAKKRGRILNVASTAAFQPGPFMAVYYATKAYVLSLSEAIGAELEGTGVTVTTLCPGPTASGFQAAAAMTDSPLVKGKKLPSADEVAAIGVKAMLAGKSVVIPGAMNWMMAQSVRFTPRSMVTALVKRMQASH